MDISADIPNLCSWNRSIESILRLLLLWEQVESGLYMRAPGIGADS